MVYPEYNIKASEYAAIKKANASIRKRYDIRNNSDSDSDDSDSDSDDNHDRNSGSPFKPKYYITGDTVDTRELINYFRELDIKKSGSISKYEPHEDVEGKVNKIVTTPGKEKTYIFLISELWNTLTEILFFSTKLFALDIDKDNFDANSNDLFQKILNLIEYAYGLLIMILFFPDKVGEHAKKIWTKAKTYTVGMGIFIIVMVILYQTTYGKVVIDFFIDITGYIINTDIRLKANEFIIYLKMKALQAISLLGLHNYINSLLQGAAANIGKEVGQQVGEKVGQQVTQHMGEMTAVVAQNVEGQLMKQVPAIVSALKDPMQLAMITAGVEGGRQATLMIDNQLAEQAKLTYEILDNMARKSDLVGLEDSIKLQLQANEFTNMLLTNQELQKASTQQHLLTEINKISDKITPIMSLMEEDVRLLNVLIEAIEINENGIKELIRLTEENLKTTNLGRIINNLKVADSKTVMFGIQTAINGINILRGQNPLTRQLLLHDGPAGGRKTRKRRGKGNGKKRGATRKKIVLKKTVKRKDMRNGKRKGKGKGKGKKGKTCKKK